ncbi:MAG TPA: hypothetical protein VME66_00205 [Candidatus Acidoferrales bacterium]|nr:hypothetical protein [Candidatus Acidoferrales bacterium]
MKGRLDFKISRSEGSPAEFCLHERCWHEYGRIDSVRRCLEYHRDALADRLTALDMLLATSEPERANRLLLDDVTMQVDEVTLRPPADRERFDELMNRAWSNKS